MVAHADKLLELHEQCTAIKNRADGEGRDLTPDEVKQVETLHAQFENTAARLHVDQMGEAVSHSAGRQTEPDVIEPKSLYGTGVNPYHAISKRGGWEFKDVATGQHVRALMAHEPVANHRAAQDPRFPIQELGEVSIGRLIHSQLVGDQAYLNDCEKRVMMAASGASDSDGGYLLPAPVSSRVVDLARSASVCIRAGAQTLPMQTSELSIARVSSDATSYWRPETTAITASKPAFDKVTLRPKVLAAIVPVSIELLEDAANSAAVIERSLTALLGQKLDAACLTGTGASGEPLGITASTGLGVNSRTSVGTPTWADLSWSVQDILTDNYAGDVSGLAVIANPRDFGTLDRQTSTSDGHLIQPSPWAAAVQKFATTALAISTATTDMVTGDFSQLLIGMRTSGVRVDLLNEGTVTDAASDTWNATTQLLKHIRVWLRADCVLLQPKWFTRSSGVTT